MSTQRSEQRSEVSCVSTFSSTMSLTARRWRKNACKDSYPWEGIKKVIFSSMMHIFILIKHDNNQTYIVAKNKCLSTSAYSSFTKFSSSQKIGTWFVIGFSGVVVFWGREIMHTARPTTGSDCQEEYCGVSRNEKQRWARRWKRWIDHKSLYFKSLISKEHTGIVET